MLKTTLPLLALISFSLGCSSLLTAKYSAIERYPAVNSYEETCKFIDAENPSVFNSTTEEYSQLIPSRLVENNQFVTHPSTKKMGQHIEAMNPRSLFRGMSLNSLDELRNIVKNGLETSKTSFNVVYLSNSAGIALDYADSGGKPIKLVFVIDPENLNLSLKKSNSEIQYFTSAIDIRPPSIRRILVFDPKGPQLLPFCSFSIAEMNDLLRN